jgi:outer membrane protein
MNNQKFNLFNIIISLVIVALIASSVILYLQRPKMAYVRSHDLIEKYQGTIEARAEFEKKKNNLISNVDSLKMDFERAKNQYMSSASKLSANQRMEQEKMLTQQQSQLIQYSNAVERY